MSKEPHLPGNTCPDIDKVIEACKSVWDHIDTLEELRGANDSLRQYGEYWKQRAEDAEARVEELEEEIAGFESDLT